MEKSSSLLYVLCHSAAASHTSSVVQYRVGLHKHFPAPTKPIANAHVWLLHLHKFGKSLKGQNETPVNTWTVNNK